MSNEYIPNGHEHANGNGQANGKAFVLTQPKTPADIQRDSILATMPKLRRHCSKDPRLRKHIGAKWMFGQISDLTFLSDYGGDGFGKLFISIKDLNRIFGHDVKSLTSWRDKLVETGWIWVVEMWPKSQWGICGICRQPELFPAASEFTRTMAKSSRNEAREGSGTNGNPSHPPPINPETEDLPLKEGNYPRDSGKDYPFTRGILPTQSGKPSHSLWESFR